MQDASEYAAMEGATEDLKAPSSRGKKEVSSGTRLTPQAARLALKTPPKCDKEMNPEAASSMPPTVTTPANPSEEEEESVQQSTRKRRAIFTDESDDGDDAEDAVVQICSVDTTAVAGITETTMQPERDEHTHRGASEQSTPHRARRVLNLMDRLAEDDTGVSGEEHSCGSDVAAQVQENDEDDTLMIRRTWKRRLTETTMASSATLPLFPPPSPSTARRPAFARSHSSQSVLFAPPKMSFARSTSETPGTEGESGSCNKIHALVLPTVRSKGHPDLNVISPQTVADLLSGVYSDRLDSFSLIDCRFGYEFAGGSLKGAVSMNDPAQVEEQFLRRPPKNASRMALIFYCEFSANRAPKMLRHIRNLDRWIHAERYPELFYPELYLIDGGYKNCFETLKDVICCHPAQYQSMSDKAFVDQCKRDFALHRAHWKLHKSNGCASKFQQLHRQLHGVFGDDRTHRKDDSELLVPPANLRSFSQLL